MYLTEMGLKFFLLKFVLCESPFPGITMNYNEISMVDFDNSCGMYTKSLD